MAKRLSESTRWDDPWYRTLPLHLRNFWDFLCVRPDAAGVWKPDWEAIGFYVSKEINPKTVLDSLNDGKDRINVLTNGYWQVIEWVKFQMGVDLNEKVGQHKATIALIEKYRDYGYIGEFNITTNSPSAYKKARMVKPRKAKQPPKASSEFKYLDNAEFQKAFNDYLEMRKENRKYPTERAKNLVLSDLHKHPIDIAVKMLDKSTRSSWTDVYPLKEEKKSFSSMPLSIKHEQFKSKGNPDPKQQEEVSRLIKQTLQTIEAK